MWRRLLVPATIELPLSQRCRTLMLLVLLVLLVLLMLIVLAVQRRAIEGGKYKVVFH